MTQQIRTATQQLRLRENQLFLALTIVIGVLAGLSAVLFTLGIERVNRLFFGMAPGPLRLVLVPTVVSIGTGVLLTRWFRDARGSGVPQTEVAFRLHGGVMPLRVPIGKFLTGVLCIGSGHSMGREGPSVQIGAGLASAIGRWMRLPPGRLQDLVPVGAVGALAAAFNTPVAAVLFALEEIIGDMNAPLLGSAVVASVSSVIVERSLLGNEPLFHVPTYQLVHPAELLAYALLGVVGGIVSLAFCEGLLRLRGLFLRLPAATRIWQPAVGGLAIGGLLLIAPQVMGVGYEYVDQALNGGLLLRTLLFLCGMKIIATIVSYASGNAGGIFAPTLYIGAMAGGAVGMVVHHFAPFPTGDPGAYALVGMGTVFAGIIRAPMTSVFMIFEITQDYQILVPLMVANLLSFMLARRYQPTPVYHALLQQDHIHLPALDVRPAPSVVTARELMGAEASCFLASDTSIRDAWQRAETEQCPAYLVGTPDDLQGLVARTRLADAIRDGHAEDPVASLVQGEAVHAHPDHPIDVVIERLAQSEGVLPVVSREQAQHVEGVVTLDRLMRVMSRMRTAAADGGGVLSAKGS